MKMNKNMATFAKTTTVDGTNYINVSEKAIVLEDRNKKKHIVPSCGKVVDGNEEVLEFVEKVFKNTYFIGSIEDAKRYPERVVAIAPKKYDIFQASIIKPDGTNKLLVYRP